MRINRVSFGLGFLFVTVGALAHATIIPVSNPSFETLPSGGLNIPNPDGPFSNGAIPGWSESGPGATGQFQPNTNAFTVQDDGPTVAYSNNGTIFQDVATVAGNTTYTLMVDIGDRIDTGDFASADLLVNGVTYTASGVTAPKGHWATFTATYTALNSDLGDTITIRLLSNGAQADFDNVRMSSAPASSVPEPAYTGILAAGLVCLTVYQRLLVPNPPSVPQKKA